MPKANTQITVPDYLLAALEQEDIVGTTDIFVGNQPDFPKFRRVVFPARTGKYAANFGKIVIEGSSDDEREVVDYIDFLLVDNHVINHMTAHEWMLNDKKVSNALDAGLYPRTLWEHDRQGRAVQTATRPQCSSSNGIDTWASNRDQEIHDFRTGETVKIGTYRDADGVSQVAKHACLDCPLGQWVTVMENGKEVSKAPTCRQTPQAIIYDVEREEILIVQGGNRSVGLALKGSRGRFGRRFDETPFNGIEYNFSYVTGSDIEIDGKPVPTFRNRPEGKPTLDNPTAPTFAVRMTVTLNNFTPQQAAPDFTLLNKTQEISLVNPAATPPRVDGNNVMSVEPFVLSPQQYGRYLQVKREMYDEPDARGRMMGLKYLEAFATDEAQAALPEASIEEFDAPFSN